VPKSRTDRQHHSEFPGALSGEAGSAGFAAAADRAHIRRNDPEVLTGPVS
jgi:hypothetical protein